MIRQIYLDMDGVLVDLEGGLRKAGLIEDNYDRDDFWKRMTVYGTDLWANLDPYPWAVRLVQTCYDAVGYDNTMILSAPSRSCDPVCSGKMAWLRKWFPDFITDGRVIFAKRKYLLAQPSRLLIDDKNENICAWDDAGGRGFLFLPHLGDYSVDWVKRVVQPDSPPAVGQSFVDSPYPVAQGQ